MSRYIKYGILNDLGKKEIGYIFPDGLVPVLSIIPGTATLENKPGSRTIYKIDIRVLSDKQFMECIHFIIKKNKEHGLDVFPKSVVIENIRSLGFIPIQKRYFSGAGTNNMRCYL